MAIAQENIEKKILKCEIEAAWNDEIQRRVQEIRQGKAIGIPAETVRAEARKKLDEARRF